MATRRPYTKEDLALDISISPEMKLAIASALSQDKKVELVQSCFKDPGPDYCSVLIDGKRIIRVEGY